GQRVFFAPEFVEEQIRKAPSQFTIHARDPANDVVIGGDNLVFAPVSGPPFVADLDGGRRDGTLKDQNELVRLSEVIEVMHHGCPEVACKDLPVETRHLDILYHQIRLSAKGMIGDAWSTLRARDHIDMMAILFGGREKLLDRPVLVGIINSNSPLRYDSNMAEGLIEYAVAGQVNIITPFIMAGATSPVTLAAAVAQQNAEALAAVALAQLVRPGSPVMYGSFLTGLEMRTGAPAFGRPEAALGILSSAQMARRYRLPCRGGGVLTNSKLPDHQAGQEKMMMLWPLLLGGVHYVLHAAGWLDGGLTASFEAMVLDAEMLEMMVRFFAGVPVDDDSLALEVIAHVPAGGHFLGEEHTRKHFRTEFYFPNLADTEAYETWAKKGSRDAYARASERCKKLLASYREPTLDPAIDEALREFVARRKREIEATLV
ncbi:MAG: trimethylamine methyltransferase family protein, partial [Acidobacteria bacterium]|nr:trimethylamine methyltransferase family protein [Acidobacteriota bacterium]